ncbi:MAG: NUDIX hydrolase [Candidatus Woesearchaeota archaeon]
MGHLVSKIAEYAIITDNQNRFLMVQWGERYEHTWHFPGGRLDEGDTEIEGLLRELDEEIGVHVVDIRPVFTKFIPEDDKWINHPRYAVFYLAKLPDGAKINLNEEEHIEYKWFKRSDIDNIEFWLPFYKEMLKKVLPF